MLFCVQLYKYRIQFVYDILYTVVYSTVSEQFVYDILYTVVYSTVSEYSLSMIYCTQQFIVQ